MKTFEAAGTRTNTKHYLGFETRPYRWGATVLSTVQILLKNTVGYKLIITHAVIDILRGDSRDR